jgi:lysophospholipase L1-like esterase
VTVESNSRTRRALRAIAKVVLILVIAEITLDFAVFVRKLSGNLAARTRPAGTHPDAVWERDDYLRGRIVPFQKEVNVGPSLASFNSLGLRGPEPRPGARRIVCLGDSVTFGWGVKDDEAYPAVLARSLAGETGDVDVINAGMPRWNSCDLMDLYVTRVIPLAPGVLVVMVGWDDIGYELPAATAVTGPENAPPPLPVLAAAGESFSLGRVAGAVARRIETHERPEEVIRARESGRDAVHWERLDEYERILAATVQLARQNGSQPVLVTLPHFLKPQLSEAEKRTLLPHLLAWPDLSYTGWRRMVTGVNTRKVAAAQAVPLADCESAVPSPSFLDVCHLDVAGNRALAGCVARAVAPLVKDGS